MVLWCGTMLISVCIDEIDYGGSKGIQDTIIGGAGTYAAIGARIVAEHYARRIGWIVDMGSDFPSGFRHLLESWQTSCIFRSDTTRLTTRAWNGYDANEKRGIIHHFSKSWQQDSAPRLTSSSGFEYLTPKLRLDENSLPESHLLSKAFHFVCSPSRCISLVNGLLKRRHEASLDGTRRPIFVWEPVPALCTPDELENFYQACRLVDLVSPNDQELAAQYGQEMWQPDEAGHSIVSSILQRGIGQQGHGMLVIRAGGRGCYAFRRGLSLTLPAYHQQQSNVIDPTGAGNAFLGALTKALAGRVTPPTPWFERLLRDSNESTYDETVAALAYASVAASFIVEQAGMPSLSQETGDCQCWNGERLEDRLLKYGNRLQGFQIEKRPCCE